MINIFKKYKYEFLIFILTVFAVFITFQHNIGLIIDCGREVYYPQEILNGKVLYKDLFNIYSPFAYLFNAFLFKIFGINLNVLAIAGSVCAIGIILGIFLLTKKLFNEQMALSIAIFAISIGIIPVYIFNYVFPYAFSMTYGLFGFLFSLLFLVNYINNKNNVYLYISLFFAGLSVSCKYEFLPYILIYLFVFHFIKTKFNTIFIGLLSFGLIPEISFTYLFAKGLTLNNLFNTFNIVINMSQTQTLKYFYTHFGVFPHKESFIAIILTFLALAIPFFVYLIPILFKEKIKNPILSLIFTYSAFCLIILFKNNTVVDIFMSLPIVLFIVSLINSKKFIKNLSLFVVIASIFLVSLKVFWGTFLNSYGIYYLPIILLAICFIFKDKFFEKEWNYISFYILILSILIGFNNVKGLIRANVEISTPKGKMFVEKKYEITNKLLEYIEKNTKKEDKILILPEGMMINFLANRKTDDFYNSFIPLYEETFGIETFRKHFEKNMPKYIIINNWNTSDYYFSMICEDYCLDFCNFIKNNYNEKIKLSDNFSYIIFEKK